MTQLVQPLLATFASPAGNALEPPPLKKDASTGLLRRPGANRPAIEELLDATRDASDACLEDHLGTDVIKKAPDPDVRRGEVLRASLVGCLETLDSKFENRQPKDPDIGRQQLTAFLDSGVTKAQLDPIDPNLAREIPRISGDFPE